MKKLLVVLLVGLFAIKSFANGDQLIDEVTFGYGQSNDKIDIYRLGVKRNFRTPLYTNDFGWLGGYYEASLNYWDSGNDSIYAVAFSPVFAFYFGQMTDSIIPYIEGGIGASLLSDTMIKSRNMSSNFNFEDRIGIGVRMKSFDLNVRYLHYSNAGIVPPNDGIDIFAFTASYKF